MDIKCAGNIIYDGVIRPKGMVLKGVPDPVAESLLAGGEAVLPADKLPPDPKPAVKNSKPGKNFFGPVLPDRKGR